MTTQPTLKLSETEFTDAYSPILGPGGDLLNVDDVKDLDPRHVWTIIEGEDDVLCEDGEYRANWHALPGFHWINRVGFVRSETPWPHENIEAMWFEV